MPRATNYSCPAYRDSRNIPLHLCHVGATWFASYSSCYPAPFLPQSVSPNVISKSYEGQALAFVNSGIGSASSLTRPHAVKQYRKNRN